MPPHKPKLQWSSMTGIFQTASASDLQTFVDPNRFLLTNHTFLTVEPYVLSSADSTWRKIGELVLLPEDRWCERRSVFKRQSHRQSHCSSCARVTPRIWLVLKGEANKNPRFLTGPPYTGKPMKLFHGPFLTLNLKQPKADERLGPKGSAVPHAEPVIVQVTLYRLVN